jgi:phospholipid transport system substrate-binding protein
MRRALRWIALAGGLWGLLIVGITPAHAAGEAPRPVVETFYRALIDVMKQATTLGFDGRYKRLQPAIDSAFNLPLMVRLAVGPQWTQLSPDQQRRLTDAFRRFSIATYASRFDGYDGEHFEVRGEKPNVAGGGTLVETRLVATKGEAVELNYLLRQEEGRWQIIDVFLSGTISELATRRSEFTSVLRRDGPDGLATMLERKIAEISPR